MKRTIKEEDGKEAFKMAQDNDNVLCKMNTVMEMR